MKMTGLVVLLVAFTYGCLLTSANYEARAYSRVAVSALITLAIAMAIVAVWSQ